MALTFIVETGQIIPNANSYVSVEEADTYLEANIHAKAWFDFDLSDKEALLIWATRYLDQRADWNGTRTSKTSSLRWPRTGVYDLDGNLIDPYSIPLQLKWATIEMAWNLVGADLGAPTPTAGLEKLKVDVIELVFTKYYTTAPVPNTVVDLLYGLGTIRGVGGFAKIKRS